MSASTDANDPTSSMMGKLVAAAVARGSETLHIKAGDVVRARIKGQIVKLSEEELTADETRRIALELLPSEYLREQIDEITDYDFAWELPTVARFRVNIVRQRGTLMVVMRAIPFDIPSFEDLGLPPVLAELSNQPDGLILVTGATGVGKSTTQAAIIDWINHNKTNHIVTLEDPIEFWHHSRESTITQREIERDTESFRTGLRAALRQDPDVILIGEMRDAETFDIAFEASETGHLVLSTMHSPSAVGTITHVFGMFPDHKDALIRRRLADTLRGVVSQRLVPRIGGGLVPAVELLIATPAVRDCILQGEVQHQIMRLMQEPTATNYGMQTFDQHLMQLVREEIITYEDAKKTATSPADFELFMQTLSSGADGETEAPDDADDDFVSREFFPS